MPDPHLPPSMRLGWHPDGRHVRTRAGEDIYVVDRGGDGRPVLLLHGILVSSWSWRHVIDALDSSFRPIALCHKGHGWSSKAAGNYSVGGLAESVLDVLDALGLDRVDIVGNSLGGGVALRIALDHPERVGRLVLVAPAAVPLGGLRLLLGLQGAHFSGLYKAVLRRPVIELLLKHLAYAQPIVDAEYMRWMWGPLDSGETFVAAARVSRHLARDMKAVYDDLPRVFKRTLIVWGERDGIIDARFATRLAARMPRARAHVLADCAHCPMEERPEAFNTLLADFLNAD